MSQEDTLATVIAKARYLESLGYFTKVRDGDQRAASLFAKLVAYELNPRGETTGPGWLSKLPGESQVDGYAEDAIVIGNDPSDRENVIDLVNGAGAPGASIGGAWKPRRAGNVWVMPSRLSEDDKAYLRGSWTVQDPPIVIAPKPAYPDETTFWKAFQDSIRRIYAEAGRKFPDPNDADAFRRFSRAGFDIGTGMEATKGAEKHLKELRAELGLP